MPDEREYVCLTMPSRSGPVTAGVGDAFYNRATNGKHNLALRVASYTILTQTFNSLWCYGLNLQEIQKTNIKYFAMLHDDVEPIDAGWLDQLIEELEAGPYDVVSAIVPIKDQRGVTSTAIGIPGDDNRWAPTRRLTMREVVDFPQTFTADAIGETGNILLPNTGCWVCRFDQPWRHRFHFETRDRIVYDAELGGYRSEVEPEDWNAGRQFHALGLRVAVTSRVRLRHWGIAPFSNMHGWGTCEIDPAGKVAVNA